MNRSNVFTHSSIKIVNSKGVLCEHPLNKNPNHTIPKTVSSTLPKYFMLFMRNILNSLGITRNEQKEQNTHGILRVAIWDK